MAASTYEECTFTQEEYEALPQKRKDALTFFVDGNVFTGVLDSKDDDDPLAKGTYSFILTYVPAK